MRAIIPTAGFGTRLRPFTYSVPKVLLQVADKPILGHIVEKLLANGIDEIAFVVGYLGDAIESYIRNAYPDLRAHFVQQPVARGLGHAIHMTAGVFGDDDEPLLIILGDTIIDADLSALEGASRSLIGVCEVEDPRRFGVVETEGDTIVAMVEKPEHPRSNLVIVGVYYLTEPARLYAALQANIDEAVLTRGEVQLTDALQRMVAQGVSMGTLAVRDWYDCGKPELLLETNRTLLAERFADDSARLEAEWPDCRIVPPVYIAPGAEVAHCVLGPYVSVGPAARLEGCVVSDSIVHGDAELRNVVLTESIIGAGARRIGTPERLRLGDASEAKDG